MYKSGFININDLNPRFSPVFPILPQFNFWRWYSDILVLSSWFLTSYHSSKSFYHEIIKIFFRVFIFGFLYFLFVCFYFCFLMPLILSLQICLWIDLSEEPDWGLLLLLDYLKPGCLTCILENRCRTLFHVIYRAWS